MGPFHIPWSTFASFLLLFAALALACGWAAWDRSREERERR